jgi:hypothetical protein
LQESFNDAFGWIKNNQGKMAVYFPRDDEIWVTITCNRGQQIKRYIASMRWHFDFTKIYEIWDNKILSCFLISARARFKDCFMRGGQPQLTLNALRFMEARQ